MKVLAIVVNYRAAALTLRAVESLLPELARLTDSSAVVVDNDSRDGSFEVLAHDVAARGWSDRVRVIASTRNGGFGAGVNIGVRYGLALDVIPEHVYLLNPDATLDPGSLPPLVEFLDRHPSVGIAGSYVHGLDGTPQTSAFRFPSFLSELDHGLRLGVLTRLLRRWVVPITPTRDTFEVDWVSGASFMARTKMLQEVGLFDEGFFLYFEETDLCMRARRKGWSTWHVGDSSVGHIGGALTGIDNMDRRTPDYWFESRRRYFEKHHGLLYRAATDGAFVTARVLWEARRAVQRKADRDPPRFLWDFLRHSVASADRRSGHG